MILVAIVKKARNLGVWFDSQLNFNVQITRTRSLSFYSLYKIRRIRKYLSYKSAQTLISALVIGRLDYSNSLLYGVPASYIITSCNGFKKLPQGSSPIPRVVITFLLLRKTCIDYQLNTV